jgi:hypothetical protein
MNLTRPNRYPSSSYRLSPASKALLARVAAHLGISQRSVVDVALRVLARQEGLLSPPVAQAALPPEAAHPSDTSGTTLQEEMWPHTAPDPT